ncbi:hypothetical protein BUALT_Bualt18G0096300 [Buddleja alternifolia]|uniref:O-acyltransferase WSD1 C-terminal domain-containing protein n=1 Tax=Buddleja alternifolia TaxID=168488 RepID=A0AAV6WDH1_9LAMI|nr:hypothetical protein BUALT_Bualt18G0096300 [Buddleja alternifolia]
MAEASTVERNLLQPLTPLGRIFILQFHGKRLMYWLPTMAQNPSRHRSPPDYPPPPHLDDEDAVNNYMVDLSISSPPLPTDKPLWEIHLLSDHKTAVFRLASIFYNRILRNTTFAISNITGPRDEIILVGNPVKTIRLTSSSLPQVKFLSPLLCSIS